MTDHWEKEPKQSFHSSKYPQWNNRNEKYFNSIRDAAYSDLHTSLYKSVIYHTNLYWDQCLIYLFVYLFFLQCLFSMYEVNSPKKRMAFVDLRGWPVIILDCLWHQWIVHRLDFHRLYNFLIVLSYHHN